jgi:hypothetical protein
MVTREAI